MEKTLAKWKERTGALSKTSAGPVITVLNYNLRAITTLSHLAQFSLLPACISSFEHSAFASLLNIPHRGLAMSDYFNVDACGGIPLRSVEAFCAAALLRTSQSTIE